jgi:hypothetical protein
LQDDRITRFKRHVASLHKNLKYGTYDTVNEKGRFISPAVGQQNAPPPRVMTPTSLERTSLKRGQLESVPEEPDESPLAKRAAGGFNILDVIADMEAMGRASRGASNDPNQLVPTEGASTRTPTTSEPASRPQIQGLEERIHALERSLEDKFSKIMDRLDAMEARLSTPSGTGR